ncbi:MAG TPA: SDR family oxidoreductase [Gemmatimonadaceae bacterium]|nr:SDR family oxidoreductase [Gemmatimonadaceae bacterium]
MILIAGATGFLGGEICRRLIESGESVRGLVRATSDPATVERLRASGVETVLGDVRDRASLDAACRGIRTVVSTVTTTRSRQPGDSIEATDEAGQLSLVDAARDAGVERFVYISYSANLDDAGPLTQAKRAVEARVRESGMSYAILRPSYFMQVWLGPHLGFDFVNRKARVYGTGERRVSYISLGDVAEFAVRAARTRGDAGTIIELGGPDAVSPLEAVRIFEAVSGAPFEVEHVPEEALRGQFAAATDSLQKSFAGLMLDVAHGDEIPMEETLRKYPVKLTSVRDYARTVLGA